MAQFDNFVLTPITDEVTAIEGVDADTDSADATADSGVYTLSGQKVGASAQAMDALPHGVYVVKGRGGSHKVMKK